MITCFRGGAFSAVLVLAMCVGGVSILYGTLYFLFVPSQPSGYGRHAGVTASNIPLLMVHLHVDAFGWHPPPHRAVLLRRLATALARPLWPCSCSWVAEFTPRLQMWALIWWAKWRLASPKMTLAIQL
jgi:hypothetical protein